MYKSDEAAEYCLDYKLSFRKTQQQLNERRDEEERLYVFWLQPIVLKLSSVCKQVTAM